MLVTVKHVNGKGNILDITRTYKKDEVLSIAKRIQKENNYVRVADIEMNIDKIESACEAAYRLTNNEYGSWYTNKNINVADNAINGCRGTFLGDMVMIQGRSYIAMEDGFEELV